MTTTVHVTNIAGATGDAEVKDFFSFCGKITDIKVTTEGETKSADVTFEKETAMKTALLLNNTQLGPNHITVASATGDSEDDGSHFARQGNTDDEITQEMKPRTRILAEYLAHGYVVGDATIQRAIELDHKHGVSSRFLSTLQDLDKKYQATDRAKTADQSYGISQRANNFFSGLSSYFEKASNTPTGKKIAQFYIDGSRQVQDIHTEARRLADLKTEEHGGSAYKAAGFDKVFGKEKPAEKPAEKSAEKPADTTADPAPGAPSADAKSG
ncbi:vip1 [Trichoderma arundinaceum]|uniref:Vip1 n=1 Tax=Trichoderma arundinaceum TaxID=490622 RepID=A0A395NLC5_TRIAR|nr:vip1 [Trichoderma arundinaceum]